MLVAAAAALCACVPYQGAEPPPDFSPRPVTEGPFSPLDPGAAQLESLHFLVRAYGAETARRLSDSAEASYNRVMVDTDLFSFRPRELYRIVVYGSQDEYRRKTGLPEWSGGVSIGNAIYTYLSPQVDRTIAHEMTHLIFFEFMHRADAELRWLNEGLAVYQEAKAIGARPSDGSVRRPPIPMSEMTRLAPADERGYTVDAWYAQATSMVRFMLERGGRLGFSRFLAALKDRQPIDAAIGASFPGAWRDLADFEQQWQRTLL